MIDSFAKVTSQVSAIKYLDEVRNVGRAEISADLKVKLSNLFLMADSTNRTSSALGENERKTIRFLCDSLFAENFFLSNPKPKYVAYGNLRVLDRFLEADSQVTTSAKWGGAKKAISIILDNWIETEETEHILFLKDPNLITSIGYESKGSTSHIVNRLKLLKALFNTLPIEGINTKIILSRLGGFTSDWEYFAKNPELQVAHFTCLPQSRWHDEIMFLKMIHLTECAFAGILASIEVLPSVVMKSEWIAAAELIKEALFFSDFLVRLWEIFETMPVESFFDGFRVATGDASAIQSLRFQKLDILTRGLNEKKMAALAMQHEGGHLSSWQPPDIATLPNILIIARKSESADALEFVSLTEALDKDLHMWRSKHYGIAIRYLPKDAKGTGDEGVPYLKNNYSDPMLHPKKTKVGESLVTRPVDQWADSPVRASAIYRMARNAVPAIAVVEGTNIQTELVMAKIEELYSLCDKQSATEIHSITARFELYQKYFGGHHFPVRSQFEKYKSTKKRSDNPAAAILLSTEFHAGMLMGLHDANRISGKFIVDTAQDGENYVGLSGKQISCRTGDLVFRDDKGIFASVLQGPDKRTAVNLGVTPVRKVMIVVVGLPLMDNSILEDGISAAINTLAIVGADNITSWIVHEH